MSLPAVSLSIVSPPKPERSGLCRGAPPAGLLTDLPPQTRDILNRLRFADLKCRCAAKIDVFQSCALLSLERDFASHGVIEALIRALPQALGMRPVLLRPGVESMSFDEAWLIRLIVASGDGRDEDRAFLLSSRVEPSIRRPLAFLAAGVARISETAGKV